MAITVIVAISSTRATHPTTMPAIQPAEHPAPEPDSAGSTFTVVSGLLWGLESTSDSVVVSGIVVSAVDTVNVVADSENEN
jgi:hypothetical protein